MEKIFWFKVYTLTELTKLDKISIPTIKKRKSDYIPVMIENWLARSQCKAWKQKNPYSIKYIRRKDFEKYMKENWFEYFLLNK